MVGRGRGRGGGQNFNYEAHGFHGDNMPPTCMSPPPLFPPQNVLAPLDKLSDQDEYTVASMRDLSGYFKSSPFFLERGCRSAQLPIRAWNRFPAELRPNLTGKRKKVGKAATARKVTKKAVDIVSDFEKLEQKFEDKENSDDDAEGKKSGSEDEGKDEGDSDKEKEEDEDEEPDEEMDGGTDYANNYFDNGEDYEDNDNDNLDEGGIF